LKKILGYKEIKCACSKDQCNIGNLITLKSEYVNSSEVLLSSKIMLLLMTVATTVFVVVNV